MKPSNRSPLRWAIRVFFFVLIPFLISCKDEQAHERLTAIESKLDRLIEKDQSTSRMQSFVGTAGKKTRIVDIDKNEGRKRIVVCMKANADWNVVDSVVVSVKRKKNGFTVSRPIFTLSAASDWEKYSYNERKKNALHLTAHFYKDGVPTEGEWCARNGTNCQISDDQKCSDTSVPLATVKSTSSAGSSNVTVSVDEQ